MMTKVCRVCGQRLPLNELVKSKYAGLGRASICKLCYRDERKRYPSYGKRYGKRLEAVTTSEYEGER